MPCSASGSGRDAARQCAGHAGLHEPRAGRAATSTGSGPRSRRLQPGRHALLPADRQAAVRGRRRRRGAPRACSRASSRRPAQLDPSIDRALEAVCLKAMALKPEDRYASCQALAEDVERWMADEPVSAWREPLGAAGAALGAAAPHGGHRRGGGAAGRAGRAGGGAGRADEGQGRPPVAGQRANADDLTPQPRPRCRPVTTWPSRRSRPSTPASARTSCSSRTSSRTCATGS